LIALLPQKKRNLLFESFSDKEIEAIYYDWQMWARPKQLEPKGDWFAWLIRTGRGWGKTRTGAEWIIERVRQGYKRIALVGKTKADVRDTMVELGDSAILNIAPPDLMPKFIPSHRRLEWQNGAIAIIYSGDEPDQLRGPQHDTAWVDELAKYQYPDETWDNLEMGLRIGKNPQVCVTTTPRPIKLIKKLIKDKQVVDVVGSTLENKSNLTDTFIERMIDKYQGTRLGRQEIEGEILEDVEGALWNVDLIDRNRIKEEDAPDLTRIVVAIDPEATSNENSAETGIIVAGLGNDGHGYVLKDNSIKATPNIWASQAIKSYYEFKADRIIAEANNGGEMIETVIKTIDNHISYKSVHASRGKVTRAEPVCALYEQNKIHHVGILPELEDQMCSWVQGNKSPDRLDALVWALTELMLDNDEPNVRLL